MTLFGPNLWEMFLLLTLAAISVTQVRYEQIDIWSGFAYHSSFVRVVGSSWAISVTHLTPTRMEQKRSCVVLRVRPVSADDELPDGCCPICKGSLREARFVHDRHAFCLTCLQKYYDVRQAMSVMRVGAIPCPACRTLVEVPRSGVEAFPTNVSPVKVVTPKRVSFEDEKGEKISSIQNRKWINSEWKFTY